MPNKLYVGNLLYKMTDDQLRECFELVGTVVSANILRFKDSGKSKGFGFVQMETEEGAQKGLDLNGQDFNGRKLIISEARPPKVNTADNI